MTTTPAFMLCTDTTVIECYTQLISSLFNGTVDVSYRHE